MKAKLKPEEERVVTPGPKAVDDLLTLPTPSAPFDSDDWYLVSGVSCEDKTGYNYEEYGAMWVAKEAAGPWVDPLELKPLDAMNGDGPSFLPSAALTASILIRAWQGLDGSAYGYLARMYVEYPLWVNTIINWDLQTIVHYPLDSEMILTTDLNVDRPSFSAPFNLQKLPQFKETLYSFDDLVKTSENQEFLQTLIGQVHPNHVEIALQKWREKLYVQLPLPEHRRGISYVRFGDLSWTGDIALHLDGKVNDTGICRYVRECKN